MREIAITASVNVTLPVIAKAGSAAAILSSRSASCKARLGGTEGTPAGRFPNAKASWVPGRCGLLRKQSRIAGLRPVYAVLRGTPQGAIAIRSLKRTGQIAARRRSQTGQGRKRQFRCGVNG